MECPRRFIQVAIGEKEGLMTWETPVVSEISCALEVTSYVSSDEDELLH